MRKQFTEAFLKYHNKYPETMFMTGDLGYNALEPIRESLGERFINAGVAEQNMVSVAAGLAYTGTVPWLYSIAPFLILKTVEQIRNDVAIRGMNVKLVGNGGGFGYGIMGTTHHVLEDIAIMVNMPNMCTYVPAFNEDVDPIVERMFMDQTPSYLRLGMAKQPNLNLPTYSAIREVHSSTEPEVVCVVLGPLVHQIIPLIDSVKGLTIWVVTELPSTIPDRLITQMTKSKHILILEECSQYGGIGQSISSAILSNAGVKSPLTTHLYAQHNNQHTYGSQQYHLKDNGLDTESVRKLITHFQDTV